MSASLFLKSLDKYKIPYLQNEIMSRHTSFCIGGNAEIFVIPENTEQLRLAVLCAKNENIPYFILGNGSNILVSDKGIRGAVICLSKLSEVRICGENTLYAGAGAKLLAVCAAARDASLSGLEFAYGIPGSVGGAVCMNAGAYGGEMKDVVLKVEYLSKDGGIITAEKDVLDFGYRKSVFQTNGGIVSGAYFSLYPGDKSAIGEKMKQTMQKRVDKQPLDLPSAGSVFKRPEGNFAGALIESCGLKGFGIGGARVSEKHAGFIVNSGEASAKDVKQLAEHIKKTVYEKHGIQLECEIRFIGEI